VTERDRGGTQKVLYIYIYIGMLISIITSDGHTIGDTFGVSLSVSEILLWGISLSVSAIIFCVVLV